MSNTRSAVQILAEIRNGQVIVEMSEAIKTAIAAVGEHGKPATVTLDITIAPLRKGSENLTEAPLTLTGEVSSKLPKATPEQTLFFVGEDGNASRQPAERQQGLGLTVAGATAAKQP